MKERAFFVMTRIKSSIEVAFRHLGHVILMKELALVAFLAETSQPMLANHRAVSSNVPVRTLWTIPTSARLTEEFTYCCR